MRFWVSLFATLMLAACGAKTEPVYHGEENPQTLSEWGQLSLAGGHLNLTDGVTPYDLNTPLFSDYAHKLRTVWISGSKAASYDPESVFDFPTGTVITKTFYYPKGAKPGQVLKSDDSLFTDGGLNLKNVRLMETRILVRRAETWDALPYVWNEDQTEAYLKRTGDLQNLTLVNGEQTTDFAYVVPNTNQCAGCHAIDSTTRDIQPIGPKARHLDKDFKYESGVENQLTRWSKAHLVENVTAGKANARWNDMTKSVDARARAYLDINCSHCHSKTGPALTSGLHLTPDTPMGPHLGRCKPPIAAGRGTGGRKVSIVPGDPDASILSHRMESRAPDIMMPELGRSLVHAEGAALIREWIKGIEGTCEG